MRQLHPGGLQLTRRLVEYCAFLPHNKVLDVGCGTGMTVNYLHEVCALKAIGIDISKERLMQGKRALPNLPLLQAAASCLPFAANSFDGVLAECSLSVMQEQTAVLTELTRILVPGGKLAISDVYSCEEAVDSDYLTEHRLRTQLAQLGFAKIIWEDHAALLREFVAGYIMEQGLQPELCPCGAFPRNKLSYFLLVAEKQAAKG